MSRTVYIGNLDERVSNRVLYDILIQAGRVVDLHIPRDRETDKPKSYAFAEYESEEVAEYAVKLFTGLVTLYNRTLRFKISTSEKASPSLPNGHSTPLSYTKSRPPGMPINDSDFARHTMSMRPPVSAYSSNQVSPAPTTYPSNGYGSHYNGHDNNRRVYGSPHDSLSRSRFGR